MQVSGYRRVRLVNSIFVNIAFHELVLRIQFGFQALPRIQQVFEQVSDVWTGDHARLVHLRQLTSGRFPPQKLVLSVSWFLLKQTSADKDEDLNLFLLRFLKVNLPSRTASLGAADVVKKSVPVVRLWCASHMKMFLIRVSDTQHLDRKAIPDSSCSQRTCVCVFLVPRF